MIDLSLLMPRRAWCAAALLSAAGQLSAMGLIQAYDAALQHDPVYFSALAENQAGQQYKAIGRAGLLPKLEYSYGNSKNQAALTTPGSAGLPGTSHRPTFTRNPSFSAFFCHELRGVFDSIK